MGQELEKTAPAPVALRAADPVTAIRQNVQTVQHVMRSIMKEGTHYGKIPGTEKNTLYQPGAEVICLAFGWAPRYAIDDLSYQDVARFRVTCDLIDRNTGQVMGSGVGEASSDEEAYRWKKAVCPEAFQATPEDRRRTVYKKGKGGGNAYTVDQVRQEPADIANTVLKMSTKRAYIAATRTASGCSDMFTQDLEEGGEDAPPPPKQIGPRNWQKLVKIGEACGYDETDLLTTAATLGHHGPGPDMTEDIALQIRDAITPEAAGS